MTAARWDWARISAVLARLDRRRLGCELRDPWLYPARWAGAV